MEEKHIKTLYYKTEHDDFVNTKINKNVLIDDQYKYLPENVFYKIFSFTLYYIVVPILFVKLKFLDGVKVKGRRNLRKIKTGFMLFGNHTQSIDSYLGHVMYARPKRTYVIANKDAVSIKGIDILTKALGALPVPDTIHGLINLEKAVLDLLKQKKCLIVFPEARIWPYYTGLRTFPVTSFKFAAKANVPCVPVALTYKARKSIIRKNQKPKIIAYIGEPIYCDLNKSVQENAIYLRDNIYKYIKDKITIENDTCYYKYVKME